MCPDRFADLDPGYDIPARIGMPLSEVATPALIVDLDLFEANLARMQALCTQRGLALRPHAKMHKSADIALLQIAAGAVGICCQKVSEAEALVRAGVPDVLVTNQVIAPHAVRRVAAMARKARVAVCADDIRQVDALAEAVAADPGHPGLDVLVEMDNGGARCGTGSAAETVALARHIAGSEGLRFAGLHSYNGPAQHIYDEAARRAELSRSYDRTVETVEALTQAGLAPATITGCGTGTVAIEAESGLYTEAQAGSYAFMDADYGRVVQGGAPLPFAQSLFLLTTVISRPTPDRAVCDAGLKSMSLDSGLPGVVGEGLMVQAVSDEHTTLSTTAGSDVSLGDQLRLVPGHCDPTCNLHDWYVGVRGGRVEALWQVTARGKAF